MARSKHGSGAAPRSARTVWPPERKRVAAILRGLDRLYPEADCELHRDNPFQLLCATILSAQCTDERVNQVTPLLFAQFPTPAAMAMAAVRGSSTTSRGHAARTRRVSSALRTARPPRSSAAKPNQLSW